MPTCLEFSATVGAPLSRARRRWPLALVCLMALGLALFAGGCSGGKGMRRSSTINAVHLFGLPMALNTDRVPGPDLLGARVYVSNRKSAHGLPMTTGRLELLMFNGPGAVTNTGPAGAESPLQVWTFTPAELKPLEGDSAIGIGYRLTLKLGPTQPAVPSVALVARYVAPSGAVYESAPTVISLRSK